MPFAVASADLKRSVAHHRDAVAITPMWPVIPNCAVLRAPVIPERNGIWFPLKTTLEVWMFHVLVQEIQYCVTLVTRYTNNVRGE
jgi:hypothetical protein